MYTVSIQYKTKGNGEPVNYSKANLAKSGGGKVLIVLRNNKTAH